MANICGIARDAEDRRQVYGLRYGCYFRRGSLPWREDRQFSDRFDVTPNHFSFLLRGESGEPLATVRIGVVKPALGWEESPAGSVFGDDAAYGGLARESFVEASRLCFGPQARRDVLMRLLGNMAALADLYRCEWLVACPREEHALLYERLFGFRAMAEPRRYFGMNFHTRLMAVRREELREQVRLNHVMTSAWTEALGELRSCAGEWRGACAAEATA